jgi:hypothetical protein
VDLPSEGLTERELLIAMRGELALIRRDNETTNEQVRSLSLKHDKFEERLAKVEGEGHYQRGAKHGFERGVRTIQALAAICGLGGIAAAAKVLLPTVGGH